MGAEDFADALERLLKLPLAEKQDREVPRVLLAGPAHHALL
jgi:nucleolar MIF4G domain-containing protein 1